ncbi:hypothetical protein C1H76_7541 [Elsinoe australis]|uniref:Uncharacterized protein n=1 Tax=Elsinoe australis TaxID=40998 RepID=A0A4U7AQ37_9PEZI|nr:hypothetical protein C1H76_7541 [Elsinoe australis]
MSFTDHSTTSSTHAGTITITSSSPFPPSSVNLFSFTTAISLASSFINVLSFSIADASPRLHSTLPSTLLLRQLFPALESIVAGADDTHWKDTEAATNECYTNSEEKGPHLT